MSQSSQDEQGEGAGKGRREDVGVGEGDHGTLLWPELALAAPGSLVALE